MSRLLAAGGDMQTLDFGGTLRLLFLEPGASIVLRKLNISGLPNASLFGLLANDGHSKQLNATLQALPTHVNALPLFPTIDGGPSSAVSRGRGDKTASLGSASSGAEQA